MVMTDRALKAAVKQLMSTQLYGVLATASNSGAPHCSIVAFVSADDLASLVFVTPRNTRKFTYIGARPQVSLFVDNRSDQADDLMQVIGVEASGIAHELSGGEAGPYRELFLAKYPQMSGFVRAPGSAIVRIAVDHYDVVDRFQHVLVLPVASRGRG